MVERSLRASPEGRKTAKTAFIGLYSTQKQLANGLGVTRQPISKFFNGKPVARDLFVRICEKLKLDWQAIAQKDDELEAEQNRNQDSDIDVLVQEIRKQVEPTIRERCGTMRVLDMSQPIGLGKIYTSVNILEKLTKTRGLELADLMRDTSPEEFDRFCLSNVRERRIPGLEAVEQFSKLMILGKPGAGKTTFLKHLAIQCIGGKFQTERVPVFITLKDFAETDGNPDLLEYLDRFLLMHPALQNVVCAGRALILLDGLDEVRDADSDRVLRQITGFSQQFPQNQFIITCRIAAREYTFEKFTEVEIADFNNKQIADFSGKWFRSKNDPIKAERFLQKLQENEPILELATNPLLLTLLCLVFEDSGSFPTNRAELYENGVDVLLKKWDVKRNIERDHVYKGLSLKRKKDLLSQIARTTFEAGNYFFKQRQVERYISEYIQNLPGASTDPEALELDSAAVLKSIEAQHGLLVERARGIYSFSHLTFHEYFTARKIVASCNPYAADDLTLQALVSHLTENRWREVFLLTIQMLESADIFVRLMKQKINWLISNDKNLNLFLDWICFKSFFTSFQNHVTYCKPVAVRVFYFCLVLTCELRIFSQDEPIDLAERFHVHVQDIAFSQDGLYLDLELYSLLELISFSSWFSPQNAIARDIDSILKNFPLPPNFQTEIKKLKENLPQLPDPKQEKEKFTEIWNKNRPRLTEQLRIIMIKYRNIGYDWQFTEEQVDLLIQYYDANNFLLDCLDVECYVSREVRQEMEDTLLLPISE